MQTEITKILKNLEEKQARPYLFRKEAADIAGITMGCLRNMDCAGQGPGGKFTVGRKVAYEKSSFLQWLRERMSD